MDYLKNIKELIENDIVLVKKKDYMNNTIGLILCKENNEIVVKYVTDERILYSTYQFLK